MIPTAENEQEQESSPTAGWEEMEESFVASSTGEGMEVIDMVEPEGSETLSNSALKDLLLDLSLLIKIVLVENQVQDPENLLEFYLFNLQKVLETFVTLPYGILYHILNPRH
ncbi:hypothetical protein HGM15179_016664 [Zosterops borbonicus]|uniref:Uncharacterized protein n=1 Tax=Zosterops borbonicus TaxID=364589 RepID=A0A8K1G267_9PASS|nr:hypothetical protein HGM15179_016664 [Zosterops borbonicus]